LEILPKQPTAKGPAELFTGDVWYDVIATGEAPSRIRVNIVPFAPGALCSKRTVGGVLAMVEQRQEQRRGRVLGGVRPTSEDHRATTFELFFDLVYVFAATQVTGYMAHEHSAHGVLQGLLLLALLWWTWGATPGWGTRRGLTRASCGRAWSWRWQRCSWSP
jgi:hypothetical protein